MDYRIKGHTPLGVSFTLPLPPTLLNLVPVFREITPGSMLNLLISTFKNELIEIEDFEIMLLSSRFAPADSV